MKTVVVLGAAGRVGDAVARAFVEKGWTVRGVARNAKADRLAPGVVPVRADAFDRAALIEACRGADVIVNGLNPLYTEWAEKVMPMAENVIAAAEATGATHLLAGNVYNYGHTIGLDTAPDASQTPSTEKAKIRIAMEALFRRRAQEKGVQTLVLVAGDFFGGTKPEAWLDAMILSKLRKDVFIWPGPMGLTHAFAYLPDLGKAFVALAEKREAFGRFERFHFAGHTMTGEEMKAVTERVVGRRLARRGVPWRLLRATGFFMPLMREFAVMSYLWRTPHSLDGRKLEAAAGPLEATPPAEAIRQAIADLKLDGDRRVAA